MSDTPQETLYPPPLPRDIADFIDALVGRHPDIESIWLVGSRANNTAQESSDWDFLIFRGARVLHSLRSDNEIHRPNIDVLVVDDEGNRFQAAWRLRKTGSLKDWCWETTGRATAQYRGIKWVPDMEEVVRGRDLGELVNLEQVAFRVWPPSVY